MARFFDKVLFVLLLNTLTNKHYFCSAFQPYFNALSSPEDKMFDKIIEGVLSDNKETSTHSIPDDRSSLLEALLLSPSTVNVLAVTANTGLESATFTTARINDRKELHDRRFSCQKCKIMFRLLRSQIKVSLSDGLISKSMHRICMLLNLGTKEACTLGFDVYAKQLLHILRNTRMRTSDICALVVGPKCEQVDEEYKWTVSIPPDFSAIISTPTSLEESATFTNKILHITDAHIDPHYQAGSEVNCRQKEHQFLCCQFDSTAWYKEPSQTAGALGAVGYCDLPIATLDKSLEQMAVAEATKNVDLIYFTGDVNAHDYWRHNLTFASRFMDDFFSTVKRHYPNTPMLFAVGNHDTVPSNFYPPADAPDDVGGLEIRHFYSNIRQLLLLNYDIDASDIVKGGYYSVKIRDGLRIVVINTNHCYTWNGWLLLNPKDPDGQLQWLVGELFSAELKKEKVHILGHSDPSRSMDCIDSWRENFLRILKRFHRTIVAQFYGHSHHDHVSVLVGGDTGDDSGLAFSINDKDERALTVAYTAASLTPFRTHFPSYRVYDVNNATWNVENFQSYFLDLDASNVASRLLWRFEYDAKSEFDLPDLSPQSWLTFLTELKTGKNLDKFGKYYKHYAKLPLNNVPDCNDSECMKFLLEDTIVKI